MSYLNKENIYYQAISEIQSLLPENLFVVVAKTTTNSFRVISAQFLRKSNPTEEETLQKNAIGTACLYGKANVFFVSNNCVEPFLS